MFVDSFSKSLRSGQKKHQFAYENRFTLFMGKIKETMLFICDKGPEIINPICLPINTGI